MNAHCLCQYLGKLKLFPRLAFPVSQADDEREQHRNKQYGKILTRHKSLPFLFMPLFWNNAYEFQSAFSHVSKLVDNARRHISISARFYLVHRISNLKFSPPFNYIVYMGPVMRMFWGKPARTQFKFSHYIIRPTLIGAN